jgi:hypothetical protein
MNKPFSFGAERTPVDREGRHVPVTDSRRRFQLAGEVEGHDAFAGSYECADTLKVDVANCIN